MPMSWCIPFPALAGRRIFSTVSAPSPPATTSMCTDVSVQDLNGRLYVEQHLELDERLSMKQAHDEVTRLETEMRSEIPE